MPNPNDSNDYSNLDLGSIEDFLNARKAVVSDLDWPEFEKRLQEMNHKNTTGSRTGDIVVVLDGRAGYLAINTNDDLFPGWHGGPTVSESYVPLIFGMPGNLFVDSSGNLISQPQELVNGFNRGVANTGVNSDGYLRNWHLTQILKDIISEFRDE